MQEPPTHQPDGASQHADGATQHADGASQQTDGEAAAPAVRTRRRAGEWVWILILALTAMFQFGRGAPSEGVVFALPAIALGAARVWGPGPSVRVGAALRWWLTAAMAVLGGLAILLPNRSPLMMVVVGLIGAAVLPVAWGTGERHRDGEAVRSRALASTILLWAALMTLVCLWELTSFALGVPSVAATDVHPTISALVEPQLSGEPLRSLLIVAWIAGGIVLLRRGMRR